MKFHGRIHDYETTDPKVWPSMVKASPTELMPKTWPLPTQPKALEKPRVTLTGLEEKWLGAIVRRSDGFVGQVWALAPSIPGSRTGVWLVANGDYVRADVNDVTVVASRGKQLALPLEA